MTRDAGNASRAQSGRPSRYSSQEEVVVTYTDGTQAVLARDAATGQFKCARCSFCSANPRTLSSHGQRGCAESSHGGQQQDVDEQELARLDMIWDAEYSVLVCQVCEEGVDLAKLDNHWRHEVHDYLDTDESRECANQVRQALGTSVNLTSTTFTKPAPGARPIKSLPTYQGYVCPAPGCGWCSTHKFVRHMRKQHRSQADKKRYAVLQRWNAASGWFSVTPAVLRLHEHRDRRPSKRARPSPSPSQAPSSQADSASEYAQSNADSSFSADVDVASASTRARRAASDAASSRAPSVASGVVASRAASVQVESSDEEAGPAVVIELLSSSDGSRSAKSASASRSSHSADVMPAPRTAASQRAAPLASSAQAPPPAPSPVEQRPPASASSYQPSSATQQTSSRQQPSSSASKPSATPLNSASQRRAPLPTLRSFFGADADKWKSAARAPKVSRDGATLNVCTWRHAEATIDEEADVCEKSFTTGEALARHVMAKHVRHAEKLRGKIMCRWGSCMNRAYEPGAMDEHMLRHLAQVAFCCPFKQCRLNAQASPTDLAAQDRHIDSYHGKASAAELRPLLLQPLEPLSALADLARFQHVAANAVTLEQLPNEKLSFERQGFTVALKKLSNRSVIAQRRATTVSTSSHLRTPASSQAVLAASQGGGEESVDEEEIRPAWSVTIEALNARETQLERAAAREAHLRRIPTGVSRRLIFDVDDAGSSSAVAASGSGAANGAALPRSLAQAPARKSEQLRKPTNERARATSDKSSSSPRGKRRVYDAIPSDSDSEAEALRKTLEELRRSHKKGAGAKYQALLEDWKRRKASQATLPRAQASNGVAREALHREQKKEAAPPSSGRLLAAFVDLPLPSSSQRTSSAQPARAEPEPEPKLLAASLMDPRRWLRAAQTQSPAPSVVGKGSALQPAPKHDSASNGQASAEPRSPIPRLAKEKEAKAGPIASSAQQRRKTEPSSSATYNNSLSRVLPETQHDNIHGRTFGGRFAPKKAVQAVLRRVSDDDDDDEEPGQSSSRLPNGHASTSQLSRSKHRSRKRRREVSDADESDEADRPVFSQASLTKKRARESTSLSPRKRKKRIICSSDEEE